MRPTFLIIGLSLIGTVLSSRAEADCVQTPSGVSLSDKHVAHLGSLICKDESGGVLTQIKVDLDRFSDSVASLLMQGTPSNGLKAAFGEPKIAHNEIYSAYAELLNKFGTLKTHREKKKEGIIGLNEAYLKVNVKESDDEYLDSVSAPNVRILQDWDADEPIYPAVDEIKTLQMRTIPQNLKYYFQVDCTAYDCRSYYTKHPQDAQIEFWRSMNADDVINYKLNVQRYNKLSGIGGSPSTLLPKELQLLNYLAQGKWPEGFVLILGDRSVDCDNKKVWSFYYQLPNIYVDVLAIKNVSLAPVAIGKVFGASANDTALRKWADQKTNQAEKIGDITETVAPGQTVLIPIRIVLKQQESVFGEDGIKASSAVHEKIGASGFGFKGNTGGYSFPSDHSFAYGPELQVSALEVNGARISFDTQETNYFDLTFGEGQGSCPFVLSWDQEQSNWIDHGKVLGGATSKDQEYTDAIEFSGLVHRFRFEEREPEITRISKIVLLLTLADGETISITRANDSNGKNISALSLYWGEAAEIAFALDDIDRSSVRKSRLEVTGYYNRYGSFYLSASDGSGPIRVRRDMRMERNRTGKAVQNSL